MYEDKSLELYETWLATACLEAAGMSDLQSLIRDSRTQRVKIPLDDLLKRIQQPSQPQS